MKKTFVGLALAGMIVVGVPSAPAQASVIHPAGASMAQFASDGIVTEVRGGRGGRGGMRMGHRGRHFGGHWRGGPRWGWGGPRYYYGGAVYPRRCRLVMTDFGLRRICHRRPWW